MNVLSSHSRILCQFYHVNFETIIACYLINTKECTYVDVSAIGYGISVCLVLKANFYLTLWNEDTTIPVNVNVMHFLFWWGVRNICFLYMDSSSTISINTGLKTFCCHQISDGIMVFIFFIMVYRCACQPCAIYHDTGISMFMLYHKVRRVMNDGNLLFVVCFL